MKNSERVLGWSFVGPAALGLIRGDCLGVALNGLAAAAFLPGKRLGLPPWAEYALAVVWLTLVVLRLARSFG